MYYKTIEGKKVLSTCKTIQTKDGVWISNPTKAQIKAAGWKEYVPPTPPEPDPKEVRKQEILAELQSMDYLTSKFVDGEDMTQYGDWQEHRKALRAEYRELEG